MIPRRSLFLVLLLTSQALAHDFWVEPPQPVKASGERIPLTIRVGTGTDISGFPWRKSHVERCFLTDGVRESKVTNRDGAMPTAAARPSQAGLFTFAYDSSPTRIELDAKKFESYLREEGLDAIVAQRKALGESEQSAREAFSRCAKTLIRVGDEPASNDALKPVGLELEIVIDSDPTLPAKLGSAVTGTLLLRGTPLAKHLVRAVALDGTGFTRAVYTDQNGRFGFTFEPGPVMLAAVNMERAAEVDYVDWKSRWSTLTFVMAEPLFEVRIEHANESKLEPIESSKEKR